MRLTNRDANGSRWTPCHTVQVNARYGRSPHLDGLNYLPRRQADHYTVHDTFTGDVHQVRTFEQASATASALVAARPHLLWGPWTDDEHTPKVWVSRAATPFGLVTAWTIPAFEGGGWRVGGTIERCRSGNSFDSMWYSDLRHAPHRKLNVQAAIERIACGYLMTPRTGAQL